MNEDTTSTPESMQRDRKDTLHEKEAALALADALRLELRASRERCGKLEAALVKLCSAVGELSCEAWSEARAALNAGASNQSHTP